MKKINIGILGCSNIADRYVLPALKSLKEYNVVAAASRSKDKAENFAKKYSCEAIVGYDHLLKRQDIDCVYISLPTGLHHLWAIKALKAGKHIFVEKSMAADLRSVKDILQTAKKARQAVQENFMFGYHPQHALVKKLIHDGRIGDVQFFSGSFGFPPLAAGNIRYDKALGGGALLDAGCYPLKAAQMFLGTDLKVTGSFLQHDQKSKVDIRGDATLVSKTYQRAYIRFSFNSFYQSCYEIWGTKGKITVGRAYAVPPNLATKVILEQQDVYKTFDVKPANQCVLALKDFYRTVTARNFTKYSKDILTQAELLNQIRQKS